MTHALTRRSLFGLAAGAVSTACAGPARAAASIDLSQLNIRDFQWHLAGADVVEHQGHLGPVFCDWGPGDPTHVHDRALYCLQRTRMRAEELRDLVDGADVDRALERAQWDDNRVAAGVTDPAVPAWLGDQGGGP